MPFTLESQLPSIGYLRVVFPYALHHNLDINRAPEGVTVSYREV